MRAQDIEPIPRAGGHLPKASLQVRGDPSIREFVFQQTRAESDFDRRAGALMDVVVRLLSEGRAFHVILHFSSNQLTCWPNADPYRYQVHVGDEVFAHDFCERFLPAPIAHSLIPVGELRPVLGEFARLRFKDPQIYLRNGSINLANGVIGMSFSCDGSHYLAYDEFRRLIDLY